MMGGTMISIDLGPEIEQRLMALAKRTGKTEAELARELVKYGMEDLEDISIAEERLANPGARLTSEQVRKELPSTKGFQEARPNDS
jgi:RHH-type rel operon transcriptional repressor/antitoxin RelB